MGMVAVLCACAMTIACGCGGDDDDDASDDGVIPDDDAPDDDDTEHDDDADDDSAVTDDDTGDDDTAPFRPDHDGELDIFSDTDRDGVTDWQERLDGTDPHDPSDATAWHPEITAHPAPLGRRRAVACRESACGSRRPGCPAQFQRGKKRRRPHAHRAAARRL
ncbi:MAG: thrombospondin type 3 repeat-containing protein [Deltaproteobacteria bacterium]|nr:thrombospondin type 3 repeat-containing protein [Deltaproteobacteria bacterium]